MTDDRRPPGVHRTIAKVFGRLSDSELRIVVLPDTSAAAWDIPIDLAPAELRMPNSLIWVTWEQGSGRATKIEPRAADDQTPMY